MIIKYLQDAKMNLNIITLTKSLSKQHVNTYNLLNDNKTNSQSKYYKLFIKIQDGEITNEEDAQAFLKYSKNRNSYLKFRKRYINKLFDLIQLTDLLDSENEKYYVEITNIYRLFTVARTLHIKGFKQETLQLYTLINKLSEKYGILEFKLMTDALLRSQYAYINVNHKKYIHYKNQFSNTLERLQKEFKIIEKYDEITHTYFTADYPSLAEFKQDIKPIIEDFSKKLTSEDTLHTKMKVRDLQSFSHTLNNETEEAITTALKMLDQLDDNNSNVPRYYKFSLYNDLLINYLKLKNYERTFFYLDTILDYLSFKGFNYVKFKSLQFTLYTYLKEYDKLQDIVDEILDPKFPHQSPKITETWKLRNAFVELLIEAEIIQDPHSDNKFKLNRFINEMEETSKDKRGLNISILIVQLMFFLIRKEFSKVFDKIEALNQYSFRYLRKDETFRSNCFIKMILKLPEASYHPIRTKRYVNKYLKRLEEQPYEISMKMLDTEIVPYEHLWEIIEHILQINLKK